MKKTVVLVLLMCFLTVAIFAATEEVDVFAYLYRAQTSNSAQLDILQTMEQSRLTGAGEFYAKALERLVSEYSNIPNVTERNAAAEQAVILAALLGEEKYTPAAANLWRAQELFENFPLARAETLMALGKIRATLYLPRVIRVLDSINVAPTPDRLYGERIAFGAIIALEKYQNPEGYLPVFFASIGWYSNRIRDQAKRSLPYIAKDPTPYILQVVDGAGYGPPVKFAALQTIEASAVESANKVSVAVDALDQGWKVRPSQADRQALVSMRLQAIDMIRRYRTDDVRVYDLLEQSYSNRESMMDEKMAAVLALASQRTDESSKRLSKFLGDLNQRRQRGLVNQDDERMARAIIQYLGQTARKGVGEVQKALTDVTTAGWAAAVGRLAEDALKSINGRS